MLPIRTSARTVDLGHSSDGPSWIDLAENRINTTESRFAPVSTDFCNRSAQSDARGTVDMVLNELKRQRRITAVMPNFLLALAVASQSDAIFTAPLSACRYAASLFPLTVHEPPIALPCVELTMLRHRQGLSDPAVTWLAEIVTGAFRFLS
jgi:DNA-binding transcriptional LysR family regulator